MKCYICDATLTDPQFNSDHNDYDPCPTCLVIIDKAVGKFGLQVAADDDDFGWEDDDLHDYDYKDGRAWYD